MKSRPRTKRERPAESARAKGASRPSRPLNGADLLIASLEREGVEVIFAYPGGASMIIHQALTRSEKIRVVLPRHEQGGVFAAGGYARATGRVGVCMATSGPGATNLVTGIADAFMDSVPLVAITGQVNQDKIGTGAFQETDIFGMTLPVVKHSYLVTDAADLPRIVREAFHIAGSGRPGPVLVDVPKNIQNARVEPVFPERVELDGYDPAPLADDAALERVLALIASHQRPLLYCGGGIITADASAELLEFVERTQIPVTTTLMGVGGFPEDHPLALKWLGMHGTVYANNAANEADLLLAIGVRFDDRVTGNVERFAQHATIVHLDIDSSEINKNKVVTLPIQGELRDALRRMNAALARAGRGRATSKYDRYPDWYRQIDAWRREFPLRFNDAGEAIQPQHAIRLLHELSRGDAIIATGVGQHQMWSGQYYHFRKPRTFLTSGGLGAMGFGLPAAIGAKVALPDRQVIDIDGDGSFLMNIQELATAHIEKIAVKVMILNNQHLGMVVQWEDRFYESNRAHTFLGDPRDPSRIYPDYRKLCEGFGVTCERVIRKADLPDAIRRMLASKEAYVLDVIVPYTEHVLPMIPAGMTYKDIILE